MADFQRAVSLLFKCTTNPRLLARGIELKPMNLLANPKAGHHSRAYGPFNPVTRQSSQWPGPVL